MHTERFDFTLRALMKDIPKGRDHVRSGYTMAKTRGWGLGMGALEEEKPKKSLVLPLGCQGLQGL